MAQTESAREIFGGSRENEDGVGLRIRLGLRLSIRLMPLISFRLRVGLMAVFSFRLVQHSAQRA